VLGGFYRWGGGALGRGGRVVTTDVNYFNAIEGRVRLRGGLKVENQGRRI
jgi:hypothetical protein